MLKFRRFSRIFPSRGALKRRATPERTNKLPLSVWSHETNCWFARARKVMLGQHWAWIDFWLVRKRWWRCIPSTVNSMIACLLFFDAILYRYTPKAILVSIRIGLLCGVIGNMLVQCVYASGHKRLDGGGAGGAASSDHIYGVRIYRSGLCTNCV